MLKKLGWLAIIALGALLSRADRGWSDDRQCVECDVKPLFSNSAAIAETVLDGYRAQGLQMQQPAAAPDTSVSVILWDELRRPMPLPGTGGSGVASTVSGHR